MYKHNSETQIEFIDFYLPFGGKLSAKNQWVTLADMLPWDLVEEGYQKQLAGTGMGAPAKSGRIAFGALLIKERLGVTDEKTLDQIPIEGKFGNAKRKGTLARVMAKRPHTS